MPPKIELQINFKIHFIGTIKIFPIIKSMQIQEIITSIFIFTLSPQEIILLLIFLCEYLDKYT